MLGTHILVDQDPQSLFKDAQKFISDKKTKFVTAYYNTTPVMVGILANGQANIIVFTSCLITWECTEEEWKSFQFQLSMNLKKV